MNAGRPAVHQILATLSVGDAVSHQALAIRQVLRDAGFRSDIVVETADARLEDETIDYRDFVDMAAPDDLLIHHYSTGSRATRTAFALPCRMALVYHNITPAAYYAGVNSEMMRRCFDGRRELAAFQPRVDLALAVSEFNRQELEALGFAPTAILPVVPDFSHIDVEPAQRTLDEFDDEHTNILFVGRLAPNKRPDDLIRAFHAYRSQMNPRSRLLLAGSYRHMEPYLAQLHTLIATLRVGGVHILGHVSPSELSALYDVADVFLCASEHEGFCVPIVEAFYKRVPVIAYAAAAVPATMDGGGVLYDTKDPVEVASLIDAVVSDGDLEARVLASQDAAVDRLQHQDFAGTLLRHVRDVLERPRRPAVQIAAGFWDQFKLSESMDELREQRPSAYHALPYATANAAAAGGVS